MPKTTAVSTNPGSGSSVPAGVAATSGANPQGVSGYNTPGAAVTSDVNASTIGLYPELNHTMVPETLTQGPPSKYTGRSPGPVDEQIAQYMRMVQNMESGRPIGTGIKPQYMEDAEAAAKVNGINLTPMYKVDWSNNAQAQQAWKLNPVITINLLERPLSEIGVPLTEEQLANGLSADEIKNLPIPQSAQRGLARAGYNPGEISHVGKFVAQGGTPGTVPGATAGTGTHIPASQLYSQFQTEFGNGTGTLAVKWKGELASAGLINPDDVSSNSTQTYAQAYQELLMEASAKGISPDAELAALTKAEPAVTATPDTAAVQTLADEMGVNLTPGEVNIYAQLYASAGNATLGLDTIRSQIADHYQLPPTGDPKGWASIATNALNDAYSQYGLKLSPDQQEQLVKQSMAQSSAPYQVSTQATNLAESTAKSIATSAFPSIAPLVQQGQNVKTILDPYLSQASQLLGIPVSSMNITDPQWQQPLRGGKDGNQLMSSTEWANTIFADPTYKYSESLGAKQKATSAAMAVGTAMGVAPSFSDSYSPSTTTGQ